ncbi:L-rhamnonate dehydratase [Devosia aurantiaca]|uniref:L-rhamnonate dehydratase n=1 Tax=Devosia aurantiaca TaxID=2714858 RepID=A0A6M1SHA9_9HYPH|nr:L-rhamnonate dehydratase [Devosia aurantiaca]NGP18847.1 L-rhamnonate dehydratase [Devosia aurantiaca]
MKITKVSARVYEWTGPVVPIHANFCTTAGDILTRTPSSIGAYSFLGWLVVEIETDTGLFGIGNAALSPHVTKAVIDHHLAPILIGENPLDIAYLWERMYRQTMPFGRKGSGMAAISAIDLALWDILGKQANLPVFRLLGGALRDKIPVYASRLYAQPLDTLAAEADAYRQQGFSMMKLRFGWGPKDGLEGIKRNLDLVRTVRETVGDSVEIMADAYMGWTLDYAKRMLPLLAPYNLRWLEEPLIADDVTGYAELRALNIIPISGGEHEFTLRGFRDVIEHHAMDIIQFDINRVGGISQAQKIVALAEAFNIAVIPHAGQMHNYHVVMANIACPMAEYFPKVPVEVGNELFWYIFDGEPVAENGYVSLPENRSGLGLTIKPDLASQFRIT